MARRFSNQAARLEHAGGFTLVELIVVIGIMAVLIASVVTGGAVLMTRGHIRSTEATLAIVQHAIEQFHRDEPSIVNARQPAAGGGWVRYSARYGAYPPDELEVFSSDGLPGADGSSGTLAPGGAVVEPSPDTIPYPDMTFGLPREMVAADLALEHRDLAALILAIELYSPAGSEILSKISGKHRTEGAMDSTTGQPSQFLDRNDDDAWDPDDYQIRYITDDWGIPLVYYAQRDFPPGGGGTPSSNHSDAWNQASTQMIKLNNSRPILMSYGPDGDEQLSQQSLTTDPTALLHVDWVNGQRIENSFNSDNIYPDPTLGEKLHKGDLQ